MTRLAGSVAVVSGGLGDIGYAIARELASRGARVGLGDVRSETEAGRQLAELRSLGILARYDRADTSSREQVRSWLENVEAELGLADMVVVNAAVVTLAGFRKVTPEQWSRDISVNLTGAFHLAQEAALRLLAAKRPGRIVFIGSWVAHAPALHIPAYCVSKAGLRQLMRGMALDLAPDGILVNEVAPGNVNAGLSARIFREFPDRFEKNLAPIPIRKMSTAEDIAFQVAHLMDERCGQTTGSVVLVDGGLSLNSGPNTNDAGD